MSVLILFDFHEGDQLDGMTVVKPVARGGNGDLYMVRDEYDNLLAIKVIRRTDNDRERRGIDQCCAVSAQIPGLVPVQRIGKLPDGRFYCVMPLADNLAQWPDYEPDTLATRIRRDGRIPPDEVLSLVAELAATLKSLHDVGLAHCDIKPENILFIDGIPMLSDYSLLSDAADSPDGARTSTSGAPRYSGSSGTAGFIPPEMLENPGYYKPKACDLYALGKIVYCAWSGMNEMEFPSVSRDDVSLQEMGVMRAVYMKACSSTPVKRFRNADEFIQAIADARSRLKHLTSGFHRPFKNKRPVLLVAILLLCAIGLGNIFFLLRFHRMEQRDAPTSAEQSSETDSLLPMDYRGDPLIVTTDQDIEDANDSVNSLREALRYAQKHGTNASITFAGDFDIRLAFTLPVSKDVIIDGEGNSISLTGPEEAPLFRVTDASLTLKNLMLSSDCKIENIGGIAEVNGGGVNTDAVHDGGTAKWLWNFSSHSNLKLAGNSHLHRVQTQSTDSPSTSQFRVEAGSVLEDSVLAFRVSSDETAECLIYGLLKNSTLKNGCVAYVFNGGRCENLTVRNWGLVILRSGGTIDGLTMGFTGICNYERGNKENPPVLTGKVFVCGTFAALANKHYSDFRIAGDKADIVFDLTERNENSWIYYLFNFKAHPMETSSGILVPSETRTLFYDTIKPFLDARSFTVRVRTDQPAGTYTLAINAEDFDLPVSLAVGDDIYFDALSVGKNFSVDGRTYSLFLKNELLNDINPNDKYVVELRLNIAEQ